MIFYEEAVEVIYLFGDFEEMDKLVDIVLEKVDNILDKMKVYEIKI